MSALENLSVKFNFSLIGTCSLLTARSSYLRYHRAFPTKFYMLTLKRLVPSSLVSPPPPVLFESVKVYIGVTKARR